MDLAKILSETKFIDCDPASDKEHEEDEVIDKKEDKKNGKSKKKISYKEIQPKMESNILTRKYIIETEPPKKIILQYLAQKVQDCLEDSDSDSD